MAQWVEVLSLASGTRIVEGESQLPWVVICPPCIHTHVHMISTPCITLPSPVCPCSVCISFIPAHPPS